MLWLALGPFPAMENQVLVIRIKIPNSGAVDWTVHSGPQLLFRDVLVSGNFSGQIPTLGIMALGRQHLDYWWPELASGGINLLVLTTVSIHSLKTGKMCRALGKYMYLTEPLPPGSSQPGLGLRHQCKQLGYKGF